jgi:uncharacterized OsmC-like protein
VAEPKARVFEFEVALDREGRATAQEATATVPDAWAPEHLVLAGLLRCSLASLRYHASRAGIEVEAEGAAHGTITRREDGRFGFVEIECRFDVRFDPQPEDEGALLARAERDCFVGASLRPAPRYVWNPAF